jgi:hypothetical protein
MLHYTSLEWLASDNPFSLSGLFASYKENKRVDNTDPDLLFCVFKISFIFSNFAFIDYSHIYLISTWHVL